MSQEGGAVRKRGGEVRKGGNTGERLPLRLLLDSRRMRREHTDRVSKDAYEVGQGEGKWFHHGCITILVVNYLKRYLEISTGCSHLSNVIPQRRLPRLDLAMLAQHHLGATHHRHHLTSMLPLRKPDVQIDEHSLTSNRTP